jgi:hypothetical protein
MDFLQNSEFLELPKCHEWDRSRTRRIAVAGKRMVVREGFLQKDVD